MTEILTESFCERCGTRYTFEPEARRGRLKGIGTLGRGIRHFVTDPGSSLDEAFAVARSEQDQRSTTHALEAFHRTFNFCLNCRQYTCGDCWNAVEGRCLTCAPTPESLEIPERRMDRTIALPPLDAAPPPPPMDGGPWIGSEAELREKLGAPGSAAEAADAEARAHAEAEARLAEAEAKRAAAEVQALRVAAEEDAARQAAAEAEATRVAAEEEAARAAAELEAARVAAEVEALAAAEAERAAAEEEARAAVEAAAAEAVAAEAVAQALAFEPGLNLDDQIADYERRLAESPEGAEVEPEVEPEAEPVAAEAQPEVVAAEPEPEPAAEEVPLAAAAASPVAPVEPIPTAVGQPLPASVVDGPLAWPEPGVAAAAFEPAWPDLPTTRRSTPATGAAAELPPMPPPPSNIRTTGAHLPGVTPAPQPVAAHACPSCGLSLSASARFCRRCGTPQQVAAQR